MDTILKAVAGILIAVVLCQVLSKQSKDIMILMVVTVCCLVFYASVAYLRPILSFIERLQLMGNFDSETLNILIKSVGIGLVAEITGLICNDIGNSAMGKSLQILAVIVILWLSVPLFNKLLDLLDTFLGAI